MARYFKELPIVQYTFSFDGVTEVSIPMTSINTKISFTDLTKTTTDNFYPYVIEPGDRIDTIADFYYNDPYRFWIVMLSNSASDLYYDFSLQEQTFQRYLIKRYKTEAIDAGYADTDIGILTYTDDTIHSYMDEDGDVVSKDVYDALSPLKRSSLTIHEFETQKNEDKKNIKLASSEYVSKIERQFKDLMKVRK